MVNELRLIFTNLITDFNNKYPVAWRIELSTKDEESNIKFYFQYIFFRLNYGSKTRQFIEIRHLFTITANASYSAAMNSHFSLNPSYLVLTPNNMVTEGSNNSYLLSLIPSIRMSIEICRKYEISSNKFEWTQCSWWNQIVRKCLTHSLNQCQTHEEVAIQIHQNYVISDEWIFSKLQTMTFSSLHPFDFDSKNGDIIISHAHQRHTIVHPTYIPIW